ncbi:Fc.00g041250.m01.CDS01 [Cosmosporella sp. VM-42]
MVSNLMSNNHLVEQSITPLYTFPVQDVYVFRHEQGTLIEMQNETEVLKRFNKKRVPFKAWVIAPIPGLTTSFSRSWILLVKIPNVSDGMMFPSLTDRFTVDMQAVIERPEGKYSLVHLPATRIQNPYEHVEHLPNEFVAKTAAFKVDVPRSSQNDDGLKMDLDLMATFQTAWALDDFDGLTLDEAKHQEITITWDTFSLTYEAELAAIRFLAEDKRIEGKGPSFKAREAFQMIQNFAGSWKTFYDLHLPFPHLKNPTSPRHGIPRLLVEKFRAFNADHRAAYDGLTRIPNGLYFVNGCPGAGKTEWNMVVAALIQSKRRHARPGTHRRYSPILFVVDLNKTVDDAADRYYNLCKAAGLKLRIVRMHGWPYEMRNSEKLNKSASSTGKKEPEGELDFTRKFLIIANISKHTKIERNASKAPTLDEEAWDYYEKHKEDCFTTLKKVLTSMDAGEALSTDDWKTLRGQVSMLYKAVLAQTDFIATTPVAAYGSFSKLFRPEVIFVDEAPHARELTTLIPIAYFDPVAWILTGDVKQTRPFVKGGDRRDATRDNLKFNPHAEQMRISTMARADMVGAINSKLLVNKRAHANLHLLPSKMFYHGEMVSGYDAEELYPPSVLHLKKYLGLLGNTNHIRENRIVVALKNSKEQTQRGSSFWNPTHHQWLIDQVQVLLQDPLFRSVTDPNSPGNIMIQTPYSAAVREYAAEVKQWSKEWQDRVNVLTVDKAQGNQADVVFLDMVRTAKAGFMNEPQRLNVAITRARQAEIILMNGGMTRRMHRGQPIRAEYTSQIWDNAESDSRLFWL